MHPQPVRTSLVYHHGAGDGIAAGELRDQLEQAGHQVVHMLDAPGDLEGINRDTTDLVVAAGGDGTISRTASRLVGRDLPLAILPMGTANNIAQTLGIEGEVPELIRRWAVATPEPLDLGVARGSFGSMPFLEGAGGGLIPRSIALFDGDADAPANQPAAEKVDRAMRRYREVLANLRPRTWTFTADGNALTGEYLIVEVLNIRSVGANLVLAPYANPGDGWFDVVAVSEGHRNLLDAYLAACIAGTPARVDLPRCRARRVDTTQWTEMHIDDRILAGAEIEAVTLEIQPAALHVLR